MVFNFEIDSLPYRAGICKLIGRYPLFKYINFHLILLMMLMSLISVAWWLFVSLYYCEKV